MDGVTCSTHCGYACALRSLPSAGVSGETILKQRQRGVMGAVMGPELSQDWVERRATGEYRN
jgi:hypothetical protein